MEKIDYKKELKHLYKPSVKRVDILDVPALNFLMVDGIGTPAVAPAYIQAVEALYKVSYTLKFAIKKGKMGIDYGVMPLEGLWWAEDMNDFITRNKENWQWTMMIMQPDFITAEMVAEVVETVGQKVKKKGEEMPALSRLKFQSFTEGKVAQTLHIGPFEEEGPTIERVHQHIADVGSTLAGKHHEIYLSDIRRAKPENWKTIIRQPMS